MYYKTQRKIYELIIQDINLNLPESKCEFIQIWHKGNRTGKVLYSVIFNKISAVGFFNLMVCVDKESCAFKERKVNVYSKIRIRLVRFGKHERDSARFFVPVESI